MENTNWNINSSETSNISINRKVFLLLLQSCWNDFMLYLSRREISKLDRAITEISLRKVFFSQVGQFYQKNKILSLGKLEWILNRSIKLTSCHSGFDYRSKLTIIITTYLDHQFTITLLLHSFFNHPPYNSKASRLKGAQWSLCK